MNTASGHLQGAEGLRIYWQSWRPAGQVKAVIVLVHGMGEHSDRYGHVAAGLVADDFAVYAVDHRGHGRSEGSRAVIDRLSHAVADLDQLVGQARIQHPGLPVYMLGHSMGGTISLAYAQRHQLDGLILSGPLAALDAAPAPMRLVGRMLSTLAPSLPLIAIDPNLVSRNPRVVDDYVSDPLVHHGKVPARTLDELAKAIERFPETVTAITIPTLILYGTADQLCPPSGSEMLGERIGGADKTVKSYEGLYHEILNEPEGDQVLSDIRAWLAARLSRSNAGAGVGSAGVGTSGGASSS